MVRTDPKTGRMYTVADPAPIDLERARRECRDHITGNGPAWHVDPHSAPAPAAEVDVPLPKVCGCMWTSFGRVWCAEHAYDA